MSQGHRVHPPLVAAIFNRYWCRLTTHTIVRSPPRLDFIGQNKVITAATCSCLHVFKFQAGLGVVIKTAQFGCTQTFSASLNRLDHMT